MSSSRFDKAAATWDEEPTRVVLAQSIAKAILAQVPVRPSMTAIDYGCGTGLVTFALQPAVKRIIGVDSSPGMLAKLQEKTRALGVINVGTRLLDLETSPPPDDLSANLVVSAMTLHHIADIPKLIRALHQWLRPGGYLALADLDTEDGSFHQDLTGVHHFGVDRNWIVAQLTGMEFQDVRATTAHVVERPHATGRSRRYPVFLVSGRRAS